jgi:sn-glycerol 3-phosphate transport system permease protein
MSANQRLQQGATPLSHTTALPTRGLAGWLVRPGTRDLGRALLYASPALIIFILFAYVPFFHSIYLSVFRTNAQGDAVTFFGMGHYIRVLALDGSGRTEFLRSIVTSFQFALMVVPAGIVVAIGLAMLATVKVRFIEVFRTIFTSSIAISLASAGTIWSLIYNPSTNATSWLLQLLNINAQSLLDSDLTALPAVAVMSIWSGLGFNFIITLAGVQAIPQDLYESASIDGAGRWTSFRHITLPLLSPTLLFLVVINTIGAMQAFTQFHLLMPGRRPNVFTYETYLMFWYDNNYGRASAMSLILFVILLILTVVQYRGLNRRVHYQ